MDSVLSACSRSAASRAACALAVASRAAPVSFRGRFLAPALRLLALLLFGLDGGLSGLPLAGEGRSERSTRGPLRDYARFDMVAVITSGSSVW